MKKVFSLMLIITSIVCVYSCSNDNEERINIPSSRNMKVGESFNLGYPSNWISSNTFAATVNNEGVISAVRKGDANIYSTDKDLSCQITISPSYTLYNEPIIQWGISKSSVKSQKGTPDSETTTLLTYDTNNTIAPEERYLFEDNKLKASAIFVKSTYTSEIVEHLAQRYKAAFYDDEEDVAYFIDAETLSEAETIATVSLSNISYWVVMYYRNTVTRSSENHKEVFKTLASDIELEEMPNNTHMTPVFDTSSLISELKQALKY